ncbi:MAG: glycoside hydrolase family 43 protein [Pyrinomonadaceae bacterium]
MLPEKNYLNPVFKQNFPDPFVWKFCGEFWAICTGFWHDGGVFGILRSRDLINWSDCGSAINPPPIAAPYYWAPEVFYENGKFYLYYSVGNEELMELRVAVADRPDGKYFDSGSRLTHESFAIDAHVFVDTNGTKYLFYATDFLEHAQIGTGTVRDKMLSPFSLAGKPQPVTRAKFNWQVYDPNRASKGGVRWHTIEGSAVLKRKNLYYQMFSGGNWQNVSYGVSYATTRDIEQAEEWQQRANGETVFPILRTIPGKVVGPGHNSVVRGTDNFQLYCVYHRWADDLSGRQMAIDRLDFAGERMFVIGASFESQPAPNAPTFQDFFNTKTEQGLGQNWEIENDEEWLTGSGAAISNSALENVETNCRLTASSFLVEVSAKSIEYTTNNCGYGFCLKKNDEVILRCLILPGTKQIEIFEQDVYEQQIFKLPEDFDPQVFHLWRVEVDNLIVRLRLDEAAFQIEKNLKTAPEKFALATRTMSAAFAGFSMTIGFEELFNWDKNHSNRCLSGNLADDLTSRGWQIEKILQKKSAKTPTAAWKIQDNFLQFESFEGSAIIFKNLLLTDFEFIVNIRLAQQKNDSGNYGFVMRGKSDEIILTIESDNENYFLHVINSDTEAKQFALPDGFDPKEFHQFRFRLKNQLLHLHCENASLGEIEVGLIERQVGLYLSKAEAVFDMVRLTAI